MVVNNGISRKRENLLQKFSNRGLRIDSLGDVLMHLAVLSEEVNSLLSSDESFSMFLKWASVMDEHYFKLGMVLDELVIEENLTDSDCLEWICEYLNNAITAMESIAEQAGMRFHGNANLWPSEMLEIFNSLDYIHTELQNEAVISDTEKIKKLAVKSAKTRVKMLELRTDWRNDSPGFEDY